MTPQEILSGFFQACANGDLGEVKYYLTSPELKNHANINAFGDKGLNIAIEFGYLDIIKYLLLSSDLKEHSRITDDCLFRSACKYGHIDIIDFALNTPQLNRKITLEASIYDGLLIGAENGKLEVVKHFIESINFQYNFDLSNTLDKVLEISFFGDYFNISQYVNSILLKKDLDISLNSKMDKNSLISINKMKM